VPALNFATRQPNWRLRLLPAAPLIIFIIFVIFIFIIFVIFIFIIFVILRMRMRKMMHFFKTIKNLMRMSMNSFTSNIFTSTSNIFTSTSCKTKQPCFHGRTCSEPKKHQRDWDYDPLDHRLISEPTVPGFVATAEKNITGQRDNRRNLTIALLPRR